VPGIIVMLMLSPATLLVIDRDLGVLDALRESRRITAGNKLQLFVTFLIPAFGMLILGAIPGILLQARIAEFPILAVGLQMVLMAILFFCCAPWFLILWTVCYLVMSGQTTADQTYPSSLSSLGSELDSET
jgi:hypothetical protein